MPYISAENQIEIIKSKFPFNYNGIILHLLNDNILVEPKSYGGRNYIMDVVDDEGYKYKIRYDYLKNAKKQKTLNKCFYNNPYTYENIDNYCKLNSINMKLLNHNFPLINYAREKLDFIDSKGNIHKIS